jgi:hypothetical protein
VEVPAEGGQEGDWIRIPVPSQGFFSVPVVLRRGATPVEIRARDKAGNESEETLKVEIRF